MEVNEFYTIDGVTKSFLDWCDEYRHSPLLIRARMSSGLDIKEALELRDNKRDVILCIDGQEGTMQYWCKIYCINSNTVFERIRNGWNLEDALKEPVKERYRHKAQSFCVNGVQMTITQMSKIYGINQSTIKSRLRKGETIEQALDLHERPQRQPPRLKTDSPAFYKSYTIGDKTKTLVKWCEEYHIQYYTVRDRLRRGMDLLSALTQPGQTTAKTYYYQGGYKTLREISHFCGIKYTTLKGRLQRGMSIQEATIPPIHSKTYVIEGEALTVKEIADKYGINMSTLKARLQNGMTVQEALVFEAKTKAKLYFIDGSYKTLRQISEAYGISVPALRGRIRNGLTIQEAVTAPGQTLPRTYQVDGEYKTLRQISEEYHVKYATLRSRLWAGKSIQEAITGKPDTNT